jgi:hypothetical protein
MSVFETPEWWDLIDRDAAIAEQFPSTDIVKRERIGGPSDRAMREAHEAAKLARERGDYLARVAAAEKSADAFIARMEERTSEAEKRRRINELNKEAREAKRRLSWLLGMEQKALKETA